MPGLIDIFLLFTLSCSVIVALGGVFHKKPFEKLLFFNTATSLCALFICALGSFTVNNSYIDIALIYFFAGPITAIAYLKYFMHPGTLSHHPLALSCHPREDGDPGCQIMDSRLRGKDKGREKMTKERE